MGKIKHLELRVGESAKLKGFFSGSFLVYAGMLNKETYSIVIEKPELYISRAYNLFIPTKQKTVNLNEGRLEILEVTPERIILEYIK